jgi:hypothetical protein
MTVADATALERMAMYDERCSSTHERRLASEWLSVDDAITHAIAEQVEFALAHIRPGYDDDAAPLASAAPEARSEVEGLVRSGYFLGRMLLGTETVGFRYSRSGGDASHRAPVLIQAVADYEPRQVLNHLGPRAVGEVDRIASQAVVDGVVARMFSSGDTPNLVRGSVAFGLALAAAEEDLYGMLRRLTRVQRSAER